MCDWESVCAYFRDTLLGQDCPCIYETERSWIRYITHSCFYSDIFFLEIRSGKEKNE